MQSRIVALVGNPNSGKSTLFNALTKQQEEVGNWCGVTVAEKHGFFRMGETLVEVIDLPGCYYYGDSSEDGALDEQITAHALASDKAELIINVVDAAHLERHLYLTVQLLEQGFSVIIVLNMMDAAEKIGLQIDVHALANHLGCSVIPLIALKKEGIGELKKIILETQSTAVKSPLIVPNNIHLKDEVEKAKARYDFIRTVTSECVYQPKNNMKTTWTEKIDKIVLNRWLGIPFFLMMMYAVFVFAIDIMGSFQKFFEIVSRMVFMDGVQTALTAIHSPGWFIQLMAFGVGQGINTTVTFIPVIVGMFLFLSFLEASGYMARAAFVMDRVMQWVGLPGKSFIPMIMGFGCNVPAIMASRTLDTYRERILTVLMTPFMSCGARLAIYAVFVAAFFPHQGQNIIFALYLIGIVIALITGFVLQGTVLQGERSALIIELPPYRWPSLLAIWRITWVRLKQFLLKAGMLIVCLCVFLVSLNGMATDKSGSNPWLVGFGRSLTPLFAPMGIKEDNWPATVGLVTGILAKEVVVGTLSSLYSQGSDPVKDQETVTNAASLGTMVERFGSTAAAFAYLLFILLYFPCVSVLAVIARELNPRWALFSVIWTTSIAYLVATLFYQVATFRATPAASMLWITGITSLLVGSFYGARQWIDSKTYGRRALPTRIVLVPDPLNKRETGTEVQ